MWPVSIVLHEIEQNKSNEMHNREDQHPNICFERKTLSNLNILEVLFLLLEDVRRKLLFSSWLQQAKEAFNNKRDLKKNI